MFYNCDIRHQSCYEQYFCVKFADKNQVKPVKVPRFQTKNEKTLLIHLDAAKSEVGEAVLFGTSHGGEGVEVLGIQVSLRIRSFCHL